MQRLSEDSCEKEEGIDLGTSDNQETGVTYPGRGQDYIVLPSEQRLQQENTEEPEQQPRSRKKWCVIGGGVTFVIMVIIIALCVITLFQKRSRKDSGADVSGTLTCRIAGLSPTEERCESAGCLYSRSESKCYYPQKSPYAIKSIENMAGTKILTLERNGTAENIPSSKFAIPNIIYVTVSSGKTTRIQASEKRPAIVKDRSVRNSGDSYSNGMANSKDFQVSTSEIGEEFYIKVSRKKEDGSDHVVFHTRACPTVLSLDYVEFGGIIQTSRITSKKPKSGGDNMIIWSSSDNDDLPYFYGNVPGAVSPLFFGAAMKNTAPMKITFLDTLEEDSMQVNYAMLGGEVDFYFFLDNSMKGVTTQFTQVFGAAQRPPFWGLGSLVDRYKEADDTEGTESPAETYVIDAMIMNSAALNNDDASIKAFPYIIGYIDPTETHQDDPKVKNSHGEVYHGTPNRDGLSLGTKAPYVDYTYVSSVSGFSNAYLDTLRGLNLRYNYPLNYADPSCEDNDINYSPYIELSEYPLHQETFCPDFIHHNDNNRRHKMIHNEYGTLQAEVYHKKNYPNRRMLILSDSVSLGAGQYAIKSTYVSQREEIEKMVSAVIWYGYIGMNAVVRLDDIVEDPRLIQMYHQMNALLPFTAGHEAALSKLDTNALGSIRSFIATKYFFYPEWLRVLHQAEQDGVPAVRDMSFNFPGDAGSYQTSANNQFMIGDKIIVSFGSAVGIHNSSLVTVDLPKSHDWYSYGNGNSFQKVKGGRVVLQNPAPMNLYFVRSSSVVVHSKLHPADDLKKGGLFDETKKESVDITIFVSTMDEQFDDHYILIEQEDLVLELEFIVTSNSQGISLSINPKGDAISRGNGDDVRKWDTIEFAAGSIKGTFDKVMMNDEELSGVLYMNDLENSSLTIYMNNNYEEEPSLHTPYDIQIVYREE